MIGLCAHCVEERKVQFVTAYSRITGKNRKFWLCAACNTNPGGTGPREARPDSKVPARTSALPTMDEQARSRDGRWRVLRGD